MALRSTSTTTEPDLGEVLDDLENRLERLKRLYEQYFLGIQKIPPSQLHKELERAIRELTQRQPRNTAKRYRLNTITQRYSSYNTYWNRVLRQIEQGTYVRDIARAGRRAQRRGEDVPDEVLAKMPALMRKRVLRDRERLAKRHAEAQAREEARAPAADNERPRVHAIDETDPLLGGDLEGDMEQLFASIIAEDEPVGSDAPAAPAPARQRTAPEVTTPPPLPGDMAEWREPATATRRRSEAQRPSQPSRDGEWREPGRRPPPAPRAATNPPPRQARPAAAGGGALPPGMNERQAQALYDNYVRARKMVGASSDVSFGKLMSTLRRQAPRIMEQHRAAGVDFNVVLKDNRVVVKATPKK